MLATFLASQVRERSVLLRACIAVLALASICVPPALAQLVTDPTLERGMKPYGTFEGGAIDSISTTNGDLNLHIPLVSYPQRGGKLHLDFYVKFDNNSYTYIPNNSPPCTQQPFICSYGTTVNGPGMEIATDYKMRAYVSGQIPPSTGPYATLATPDGSEHEMGAVSGGWRTIDATGYLCLNNCATIIDRNGIRYSALNSGSIPQRIEDPNGNYITATSTSAGLITSYTDTMGRNIPVPPDLGSSSGFTYISDTSGCTGTLTTATAFLWSPPGYQGGQTTYKICYANVYYGEQTCLKQGAIVTCSVTLQHNAFIQSIVLPNNTTWTFQYDSANPNVSGSTATGNLLQITFPTGGYIKYGWGAVYICQGGSTGTGTSSVKYTFAVASRTINSNDGTGDHTTSYSFVNVSAATNNSPYSTSSTDPVGTKTVHTLSAVGGTCSFYETQTQTFDSAGILQKTVTKDYTGNVDPLWAGSNTRSSNVVQIRVTTTWPNGQVSKVETDYDAGTALTGSSVMILYGNPIAKREYDYGTGAPGALVRTTTTAYQALNNSSYLSNNLLSLPSSVVVTDSSGVTRASTNYSYDQFALASSGVSIQHDSTSPDGSAPGNLTTVVRGYTSTTTTNYFDTGTVYQLTDPNGNTTTSAYSSTFFGAYPTTITNALNQSASRNYDFNTGSLTSITDPNQQTASFGYDGMWRITQVNYPDGGQETISRQESAYPFTATLTKKITASQNAVSTNVFDGFGRVTQTQLSDPQGTVYTDTAYDALGRVSTGSNPYRAGTDITTSAGTTSYGYDALSRRISETYPGNSVLTTAYCGPSTLVTDPTGKWRRSRADGLGRLVEVDEPNSTTATVASTGCPASGEPIWITTYGYDTLGNLTSVLQNGSHQRSFSYDMLSRLNSATNPESGTITYNYDPTGNVIQKTDARSLKTDYSYDALNRLSGKTFSDNSTPVAFFYDGQTPPATSPTSATGIVTVSGAEKWIIINPCAPVNRSCPTRIYDAGSVSITTNGVTNSVNYNSASTPITIATALASAINSNTNSPVTATASNATVMLTAKATGPASDYSLSAGSVTTNTSYFSTPSFTPIPFGFNLDGGCNVIGSVTMTNGVGRRTGMCDVAGAEAWTYDPMGRVATDQRSTSGVTRSTNYQYNLAGSVGSVPELVEK